MTKAPHLTAVLLITVVALALGVRGLASTELPAPTATAEPDDGSIRARHAPEGLVALVNRTAPARDLIGSYRCAGTLVRPRVVVTAWHCIDGVAPEQLSVIAGTRGLCAGDVSQASEKIPVSSIITPEPSTDAPDLAVLRLAETATARPLDVSARHRGAANAEVFGWGTRSNGSPCRATASRLELFDRATCARSLNAHDMDPRLSGTYWCGVPADGSENTCTGDSGGPVLVRKRGHQPVLIGVVSSGWGCGADDVGSYTKADVLGGLLKGRAKAVQAGDRLSTRCRLGHQVMD